jgi:hypothetical protein
MRKGIDLLAPTIGSGTGRCGGNRLGKILQLNAGTNLPTIKSNNLLKVVIRSCASG